MSILCGVRELLASSAKILKENRQGGHFKPLKYIFSNITPMFL